MDVDNSQARNLFTNPGIPWLGKAVFCLGSGPSLSSISAREWRDLALLQKSGKCIVLGINSSFKFSRANGVEVDALFFTDENWFEDNRGLVEEFKGLKFTVSRRAKNAYPELMRIENRHQPWFEVGHPPMKDGRSSGHRAVSLSIMLGANLILLLGYDMRIVENRSHYHDEYSNTEFAKAYSQEFVRGFDGWHEAALKVGCQIINCTPGSAVDEFPFLPLETFLQAELES